MTEDLKTEKKDGMGGGMGGGMMVSQKRQKLRLGGREV